MGQPVNILLIEDNQDDALLFEMGAQRANAKTVHVTSAVVGLLRLQKDPLPDLIVLDLGLPGMAVNTFLNWIRVIPKVQRIPIVVYTGGLRVPEDIKAAVRQTFFKSQNLAETRQTVLKIIEFAEPAGM